MAKSGSTEDEFALRKIASIPATASTRIKFNPIGKYSPQSKIHFQYLSPRLLSSSRTGICKRQNKLTPREKFAPSS
jgi:hypothetical protein